VAETVQTQFGMLIPDDQFEKMVATHVKEFFESKIETGRAFTRTLFADLVWAELTKLVAAKLDAAFKDPELIGGIVQHFNMTAAVAGYTLPDLMQKMLDRSIHKMTEALVTNIFVHQVQEHKHTIVEVVRNAQRAGVL
jgi:hypothetical protein